MIRDFQTCPWPPKTDIIYLWRRQDTLKNSRKIWLGNNIWRNDITWEIGHFENCWKDGHQEIMQIRFKNSRNLEYEINIFQKWNGRSWKSWIGDSLRYPKTWDGNLVMWDQYLPTRHCMIFESLNLWNFETLQQESNNQEIKNKENYKPRNFAFN